MAKRSSYQGQKRRDRTNGISPYQKTHKTPWPYTKGSLDSAQRQMIADNDRARATARGHSVARAAE